MTIFRPSIADTFLQVAARFPTRTALWCRGNELTYQDLRNAAASMAWAIRERGEIEPFARIAILSERTPTIYIGVLSALLAGGTYVPLNPRFPLDRNRSILESSGASVIICDERHRMLIPELTSELSRQPLIVLPESVIGLGASIGTVLKRDLDDLVRDRDLTLHLSGDGFAYILFTSGSTGKPKGVPISHGNVHAYVDNASTVGEVTADDRIIQLADITFDISVHDMFVTWLNGAALYSVPERATLMAGRFVEDNEITGWFSVPSTAGILKQSGLLEPASLPSLKFTFFCGEALTGAVAEAWCAAAPNSKLFNLYGPTEATVAFSVYRYKPGLSEPPAVVSLGEPFPDQSMGLFTSDGVRCDPSGIGEICLSGSQVMAGYWNAPDLNSTKFFMEGGRTWYRTGDLGRHDNELGYLFAGRVDHQVKLRGFRVELQEIEAAVRNASGRDVVAVLPWPVTADGGATGCIAFVSGPEGDREEIRTKCSQTLPDYMMPSYIFFLADMPLNSSGKVDYMRLRSHPALDEIVS